MDTSTLRLSHRPSGIEHPYHQEPDERFPRRPLAGQPVSLGVRTWPPGAAQRVWATWMDEREQIEHTSEASLVDRSSEAVETMIFATSVVRQGGGPPGDTWRVDLPPFAMGQRVTYRLHAASTAGQVDSPEYSFLVPAWSVAAQPRCCRLTSASAEIQFIASGGMIASLVIRLVDR